MQRHNENNSNTTLFTNENNIIISAHPDEYNELAKSRFATSICRAETTLNPKTDFYSYVNSIWLEKKIKNINKNPNYFVKDDAYSVSQDEVYHEIMKLLTKYIDENSSSESKNVHALMKSLSTPNKCVIQNARDIDVMLSEFRNIGGDEGMYRTIGYISSNDIVCVSSPIICNIYRDEKNSSVTVPHLGVGQLPLEQFDVYNEISFGIHETIQWKRNVKREYLKYITELFNVLAPGEQIDPKDIWDVEISIYESKCDYITEPNNEYYNPVTGTTLKNELGFNWSVYAKHFGFDSDNIPNRIIVDNFNAIRYTTQLIKNNWDSPKWHLYWRYVFYKQMIRFDMKLRTIHYNFYKRFLIGQDIQMPDDIYPVFGMGFCFNRLISDLYYDSCYDETIYQYITNMTNDIKTILINKLHRNKWLQSASIRGAVSKINKLSFVIGKPHNIDSDANISFSSTDAWGNMMKQCTVLNKRRIQSIGNVPIDTPDIDWDGFKLVGTQCYTANAYYHPNMNSIYIPIGYMRKPFIDLNERGIEYNLAYIGYTIGHELCHALDDLGSYFDGNGNMNDWLTKKDRRQYDKIISDVKFQYETVFKSDEIEIEIDVMNNINENLADIGGLSLVEEYLFTFLTLNDTSPIIQHLIFKEFYVNLAIQSRQFIKKKAMYAELRTNPHPPEKYRCNCSLARSKLFQTLYQINDSKSPMYWNNTNQIW